MLFLLRFLDLYCSSSCLFSCSAIREAMTFGHRRVVGTSLPILSIDSMAPGMSMEYPSDPKIDDVPQIRTEDGQGAEAQAA